MSIQFGDIASQRASSRARNKSKWLLERGLKIGHATIPFQQVSRPILTTDTSNTKHVHTSEDSLLAEPSWSVIQFIPAIIGYYISTTGCLHSTRERNFRRTSLTFENTEWTEQNRKTPRACVFIWWGNCAVFSTLSLCIIVTVSLKNKPLWQDYRREQSHCPQDVTDHHSFTSKKAAYVI